MNIFQKFIKSFYDFKAYIEFKKQSGGKALIYVILVSVLFTTLAFMKPIFKVANSVDNFNIEYKNKIPEFTIKNGKLDIKNGNKFKLDNLDSEDLKIDGEKIHRFVMDDTTYGKEVLDKYDSGIFMFDSRFAFKYKSGKVVNLNYTSIPGLNVSKNQLFDKMKGLVSKGKIAIPILIGICFLIGDLFKAILISIIGIIIKTILDVSLRFKDIYKLTLYALTPAIILRSLAIVFSFEFSTLLFSMISLVYLLLAIRAIKIKEEEDEEEFFQ